MNVRGIPARLRQKYREGRTEALLHRSIYEAWRLGLASSGHPVDGARVLDIGTGDRAPLALQFAADGAKVAALDLRPVALGWHRPLMWFRLGAQHGLRAAARCLIVDVVHTARYWDVLGSLAGRSLPMRSVRMHQAGASALPFEGGAFDIVVSSAVWEHLSDVRSATREVARVLAPGGIAIIQIALYPSLQGGHEPDWHTTRPRPRTVRPWDHLRTGGRPAPLYLNGWREQQHRSVIDEVFGEVVWEDGPIEGREYLTAEIRSELAGYTERDLTLSWITAWCRQPS